MGVFKKTKFEDFGLGSKATAGKFRFLNKDGTFNVTKYNVPFFTRINAFHSLITMPWLHFMGWVFVGYLVVNVFFALIYLSIGVEHLTGIIENSLFDKFVEAFFFSSQTITTLGYGRVAPVGLLANIVASIESMLGLMSFALATGMLFGRFSRPTGKILYSEKAVVAPFQDINGFMFRITNPQANQLLDVEVSLTVSMQKKGQDTREFHLLDLERPSVVFLPSVWTIVHPISDDSPLNKLSQEDFENQDVEFIVMIKAFDESSSQQVYSRSSYKASEISFGEKFAFLIEQTHKGIAIDVSKLNDTIKADLN